MLSFDYDNKYWKVQVPNITNPKKDKSVDYTPFGKKEEVKKEVEKKK